MCPPRLFQLAILVAIAASITACGSGSTALLSSAPATQPSHPQRLDGEAPSLLSAPAIITTYAEPDDPALGWQRQPGLASPPGTLTSLTPTDFQSVAAGPTTATIGELARAALLPHPALAMVQQDGVSFRPVGGSRYGLIFYPGGNVPPEAYAALARAWALAGYTVCIPAMPRQMAIYAPNRATDVMRMHPEVQEWVIGGHSLGGVTASIYAAWHIRRMAGLFLLAAVPGPAVNLSRSALPVLSLYGTQDRRVPLAEVSAETHRMSQQTRIMGLDGANHAQFGDYGPHANDGVATISRERQHELIIEFTLSWLKSVWAD